MKELVLQGAAKLSCIAVVAALIAACSTSSTSKSNSEPAAVLPAAPEVASGYRTGLVTTYASKHMAAAANPFAVEAGRRMLRAGGSAIDAAVAMQAVLTLVEPQATGVGGGAFIMYWDGKQVQAYDGRETAPAGASETLFLRPDGKPLDFSAAQIGGRSVGTPGVMRALELAHRAHGKLPWADLFVPAIELSERGFPISPRLYTQIAADKFMTPSTDLGAYFLTPDGKAKPVGTLLKNPALAQTLREIAQHGSDVLYSGPIAEEIVRKINTSPNPGSMSLADLKGYRAKERQPVCSDYRQWKICGMPPPSSGGIAMAQILGILQALQVRQPQFTMASLPPAHVDTPAGWEPDVTAVHAIAEADRLAYADRGLYVADTDFVPVNIPGLLDPTYLARRAELIGARSMGKAEAGVPPGTSMAFAPDRSPPRVSTSQIVAVDDAGGAISMTTTVESYFGSHLMAKGFVLNNQLTDFSFVPSENGKPVANRVQAGKRPRSSMAPTLVFDRASGELVATVGSPGGSQIIEYVAKTTVALLDWKMDPQAAINLPNFGSRNGPTELEQGLFSPGLVQTLKNRGHEVAQIDMTSGTQAIMRYRRPDGTWGWAGGADPRREGVALGD
jgi:gamma-glutamyltranspeptidase/glutathione hydrolase